MTSPKGARIAIYCALLMMHTLVMMKVGKNLISHFNAMTTTLPPLVRETRQNNNNGQQRRILSESKKLSEQTTINDGGGRRRRNDFLDYFEHVLANEPTIIDDAVAKDDNNFAALVVKENKVYCRKSQMKNLSRGRYFVQMLSQSLRRNPFQSTESSFDNGFPLLLKHDDSNGCYPATRRDKYGFPRLTWSIPANATYRNDHGDPSWCSAIGMPSYKAWKDSNHHDKRTHQNTQKTNNTNNVLYPWNKKLRRAVWRGSTTCNKGLYGKLPLDEIPRSKLIKKSMERPDLIDAGFHKLVGKYEESAMKESRRMLKEAIPSEDMMMYKAIIDIDGNNWSARFHSLLCTNSIVIKISPDFIEQYYQDLKPNVHYVPARIENLTQVVEYVMEEGNDAEMKGIVEKANEWCRGNASKESFARRAGTALDMYRNSMEQYDGGRWMKEWGGGRVLKNVDDLIECDV